MGCHFLFPGIKLPCPALARGFFTSEPPGKPPPQYVVGENGECRITKAGDNSTSPKCENKIQLKRQTITSADKNVERVEASYTAGETIKWYSHYGKGSRVPQSIIREVTT